jgi:hypothetical protein
MPKSFKKAFVGVALISTLLLTSCGLFKDQQAASNEFFDVLSTDVSAAYDMSAPEFKEVSTLEELQAFVDLYPETLDVVDLSFDSFDMDNNYTEIYGTITYGEGWSESVGVYLYKSDMWRVGGFEMGI